MSTFFFNVRDSKDRIEDIREVAIQHPDIQASHDNAAALRKYHWDNRRTVAGSEFFGDPTYQWMAHIPGKVAMLLDLRHPGWDADEQSMREVLKKYPECNVLPSGGDSV